MRNYSKQPEKHLSVLTQKVHDFLTTQCVNHGIYHSAHKQVYQ